MNKYAVAIRGLKGVMDDKAVIEWAKKNDYTLKIFNWSPYAPIENYVRNLEYEELVLIGFSKGAEVAYEIASKNITIQFDKVVYIGTYHTVTSSFGTSRRPDLPNVSRYFNFIEDFQQPKDFNKNPNNVSLGSVSHFGSVRRALGILDTYG